MSKILNQWGLGPALAKISHKCTSFKMRNGGSGDYIGAIRMTDSFLLYLLADFLFMQHGHLHTLLYEVAKEAGVRFLFNAEVTGADPVEGTVTLRGGDVVKGDVIVAADGHDSILRPVVTGEEESMEELPGQRYLSLAFQVPTDALREDRDLALLTDPLVWYLWVGDGYIFHGNLVVGGQDFTVNLVSKYHSPVVEGDDQWQHRSFDEFELDYSKFEPRILKLLKLAKNVAGRVYHTQATVDSIVCENSRIVLVGEAGHPLVPGSRHSTSLAIEDAQTLGRLFSHIKHKNQLPQFLNAYEEIRQPRVSATQEYEQRQFGMFSAPAGPPMAQRDAMMRAALAYEDWEHMDEDTFKMVWGNELTLMGHDAGEQVDDWWTQWRSFFEGKERNTRQRDSIQIPVLHPASYD
ncbi:hypothetical protein MD484_g8788, partial [Candolleomyces efflorescens]